MRRGAQHSRARRRNDGGSRSRFASSRLRRALDHAGWPLTNVTVKQLQAFVAVADLGRFNLAASHLNVTQSAVSILIKELEGELQHRLFDRSTRMVSPTRAAREFLPQARKFLDDLENAVDDIRDLNSLRRGSVAVAAAIVLAATVLPPAVARTSGAIPTSRCRSRICRKKRSSRR